MAITAEIDLTLESDFASQYDKKLRPDRMRRREDSNLFEKPMRFLLLEILLRSNYNPFFQDGEWKDRILDHTLNFYYSLFGMSPRLLRNWGELDPYAPYFFGAGIFCDCCGVELNILNTGLYICCKCEKRDGIKSMEII